MPYIKPDIRKVLEARPHPMTAGELNYLITRLADNYLDGRGFCYATINDVIGALECAKLELYRRLAAPYEDTKIAENGDVYTAGSN